MDSSKNIVQYSLDETERIAKYALTAGIVRGSLEKAMVQILIGQTLGLTPLQSLQGIDLITMKQKGEGNDEKMNTYIFIKPKLLAALIKQSNRYDYVINKIEDDEVEIEVFEVRGSNRKSLGKVSYTMQEAVNSRIALQYVGSKEQDADSVKYNIPLGYKLKHNYKSLPKEMLFYRCIQRAVTFYFPDVLYGMPIYVSEIEEFGEKIDNSTIQSEVIALPDEGEGLLIGQAGADFSEPVKESKKANVRKSSNLFNNQQEER